ncbi:MAG: glutathione ABC transporter substrate-binding protein [Desulfobacteraceae bacterium]|nr:glutathione ABC transporter substrate-binding protein [Desulfobacteraceae bacterium]
MKKRLLLGLLALILVTALVAPCGASEGGKTIIFALGAEPVRLDPPNQTDNPSEMVVRHVHDNLVEFTETGDIKPVLATSWDTSEDGLTWNFYLREGVKFHDGTPFNAQAVVVNINRNIDPEKRTKRTSLYEPFIASAEAVGEHTVRLHMKLPFGALLAHFAHGAGGMVSPKALEEQGDKLALNPVGTGPFVFKEWVPGDRIVLVGNKDYWKGAPKVEKVVFKPVPEAGARVMMLETGEADVVFPVPLIEVDRLKKAKNIKVFNGKTARTIYIGMNVKKSPFGDTRVRKAVNYAVNKNAIVKNILNGMAIPSQSMLGSLVWGYSPAGQYEYNPKKAKELLAEAGFPDGFETTIWTPEGRYPMDAQIAEAVAGQLQKVGIKVKIQKMEWATFLKSLSQGPEEAKQEMFLMGWSPSTGDADWVVRPLFHSGQWKPKGSNRFFYANPELDKYIEAGMRIADPAKRREVYADAQRVLFEDPPWIMLHDMIQTVGIAKNLENVTVWPIEIVLIKDAYFK